MTRDGRVNTYLALAARCIQLAQETDDKASKLSLLDLARGWLAMAEQSEKDRQAPTLGYETPTTTE